MTTEKPLVVDDLSCIRQQKPIFANLSFQLAFGELLLIEGPNGSGKSSLLRLLTGLSTPSKGRILWQEKSIQQLGADYQSQLHYMSHDNGTKFGLTVLENLQLAQHLSQLKPCMAYDSLLSLLQLKNHQHIQAKYLSAGQKRRLALAKLFLFPKPIWILDEPLTALDSKTQTLFLHQLKNHLLEGGIGIISSHHAISLTDLSIQTLKMDALC